MVWLLVETAYRFLQNMCVRSRCMPRDTKHGGLGTHGDCLRCLRRESKQSRQVCSIHRLWYDVWWPGRTRLHFAQTQGT